MKIEYYTNADELKNFINQAYAAGERVRLVGSNGLRIDGPKTTAWGRLVTWFQQVSGQFKREQTSVAMRLQEMVDALKEDSVSDSTIKGRRLSLRSVSHIQNQSNLWLGQGETPIELIELVREKMKSDGDLAIDALQGMGAIRWSNSADLRYQPAILLAHDFELRYKDQLGKPPVVFWDDADAQASPELDFDDEMEIQTQALDSTPRLK